ncbi:MULTISPECIES: DUF4198 domain-containing protein [Stenotrophomonas]|uniref:DUF4198 domain-containing protein n=1 Tax=Stenotrophomonas TaxID=40323 RepID=UPI000D7E368B|nr:MULTISPECIES: DUF4198 domain-containing protein [Stenotrophomonas]AWT14934.1 DUF4198 domain-containing protein [Stenotrophomonas maltophilia]MRI42355.1 DUF4198 domain-containing protein [Stenotrophomonas sp. MH181796]
MKTLTLLATAALALAASLPASAHTPYLVPSNFAPRAGQTIALDASFAETFFVPETAFDGSHFSVVAPDGTESALASQAMKTRTVAEYTLPAGSGTYRLSTGPRLGALFRTWELNGKRESSRDPAVRIPAGAQVISDFQSLTQADSYVSVGSPDRAALKPRNKGIELVPVTHPNDLYVGETFEFIVQYDGVPLAGHAVEITEAVWSSDRSPQVLSLKTDGKGRVRFPLRVAGTWIALARHRTAAPAGSPVAEFSNSITLSFRVLNP